MKKTTIATLFLIFAALGMITFIIWGSRTKNKKQVQDFDYDVKSVESGETITSSYNQVEDNKKNIVFYYSVTCPHCADVEDWMKENGVEEKIKIEKKEVYNNKANAFELTKIAAKCGLDTDSIGVPFLYTPDGRCLIGTPNIIDYLSEVIKSDS